MRTLSWTILYYQTQNLQSIKFFEHIPLTDVFHLNEIFIPSELGHLKQAFLFTEKNMNILNVFTWFSCV
jgi:hypothetical protein